MSDKKFLRWTGRCALAVMLAGSYVPNAHASSRHHSQAIQSSAAAVHDSVPIGDKIVAFALQNQGRQVGDGECYDLADKALRHVGAKSAPAYGAITEDADYVWGVPVALKDARPGDIVQFRGFTVKTIVTETEMTPYGGGATSQRWVTETRDHHTSIVERNSGGALTLLEQNVEPRLVVQRTVVPVVSMTVQGSPDGAPGVATTTFEVAGVASVYRPQMPE